MVTAGINDGVEKPPLVEAGRRLWHSSSSGLAYHESGIYHEYYREYGKFGGQ